MPAARIAAISDRRAGADSEEGGTDESNSHLHAQRRYNWRLEDRHFAATTAASICRNTRCEFEMTDWGAKEIPNNPTGKVPSRAAGRQVLRLLLQGLWATGTMAM